MIIIPASVCPRTLACSGPVRTVGTRCVTLYSLQSRKCCCRWRWYTPTYPLLTSSHPHSLLILIPAPAQPCPPPCCLVSEVTTLVISPQSVSQCCYQQPCCSSPGQLNMEQHLLEVTTVPPTLSRTPTSTTTSPYTRTTPPSPLTKTSLTWRALR